VRVAEHGELDALQLIEASAQSLAVLMGARLRQGTAGSQARASGMLVGAKGFAIQRGAAAGERVDIDAVLDCEFGPLQLYRLTIHAGEALEVIGAGELKVASVAGNP
jgi:predicted hotdog family 3-hydroxylacyl-ACP dehydratase